MAAAQLEDVCRTGCEIYPLLPESVSFGFRVQKLRVFSFGCEVEAVLGMDCPGFQRRLFLSLLEGEIG